MHNLQPDTQHQNSNSQNLNNFQNPSTSSTSNLAKLKVNFIAEFRLRIADKIIESNNAQLLEKLIFNAESKEEALNIAALGTTYKRTGFHFDKRLEK